MIKTVVNNYTNPYEVTCPHCSSIMTFGDMDKRNRDSEYAGGYHWSTYIDCPCCRKRIILDADGSNVANYRRVEDNG